MADTIVSKSKKSKLSEHRTDRPQGYCYSEILEQHLHCNLSQIFNGQLVFPRQLEIHLPGDHKIPCQFMCPHCQGQLVQKPLAPFEPTVLELMKRLEGKIPYYIYGGLYTEPLLNQYLLDFIRVTKATGSCFGVHTNGALLKRLELQQGLISEICKTSTDGDYLSISIDAATPESHMKVKNVKQDFFTEIIEGLQLAVNQRNGRNSPSIRVTYLLNKFNSSEDALTKIVTTMKDIRVDSLRFSIPYQAYGTTLSQVMGYKERVEITGDQKYRPLLKQFLSADCQIKPYIVYISPEGQDVEKMDFTQCIFGYYQITVGADGRVYRCACAASPSFPENSLGKVTNDLEEFSKMVLANQDANFQAATCFKKGARCSRVALDINTMWNRIRCSSYPKNTRDNN